MKTNQAIIVAITIACIPSCAPRNAPYAKATSDPHIVIAPAGNPVWIERPNAGAVLRSSATGEWFRMPETTKGAPNPGIPYLKPTKEQRFAIDPSGELVQINDHKPGAVVTLAKYEGKYFRIPEADPNAPSPSSVPGYIPGGTNPSGYRPGSTQSNLFSDPVFQMQQNMMHQQLQRNIQDLQSMRGMRR